MSYAGSREFHDLIEIFERETEKRFVALSVNWSAEAAIGHITRILGHWGALGETVRLGGDWTSPAVRVFGEAVLGAWAYGVDHQLDAVAFAGQHGLGFTPHTPADAFRVLHVIHDTKSAGYGCDDDPLSNFRRSSVLGLLPWQGALLRASDKVSRLQSWLDTGRLAGEGVLDALYDLASYVTIAIILRADDYKVNDDATPEAHAGALA